MNLLSDHDLEKALVSLGFKGNNFNEKGVMTNVEAFGENFSHSERQLICFSRALVQKKKFVVFDEATGSYDCKTQQVLEKAIENNFGASSVVIVARRVESVIGCDRVIVFEQGRIVESGLPKKLLENDDGWFSELYKGDTL